MYETQYFQKNDPDELVQLLSSVLNTSNDGLFISDKHGYPLMFNQVLLDISGVSGEVFNSNGILGIVEKNLVPSSSCAVTLKTKKAHNSRITYYTGRTADVTAIPFFDNNQEIIFVVSYVRDVTEMSRLQEELEETKQLNSTYQKILEQIQNDVITNEPLIYRSQIMNHIVSLASRFAQNDSPILILGESGVGKDVLAQHIHKQSKKTGSLIKINCGAIPEHLLESELFGYEKGAFTGAARSKEGLLELAHEGTIFLDEIGDLPYPLQVKLLNVLQDSHIRRVGGTEVRKVNMRVIAATNCDLETLVEQKKFRQDLYYRLNVLTLTIPPLRERDDDIVALMFYYLKQLEEKYKMEKKIDNHVIELCLNHHWPGNIRELKNVMERMYHTSENTKITINELPSFISNSKAAPIHHINQVKDKEVDLKSAVDEFEKEYITQILSKSANMQECAVKLGINISTLVRKKRKLAIK